MDMDGIIQVYFEEGGKKVVWGRLSGIQNLKSEWFLKKRGKKRRKT